MTVRCECCAAPTASRGGAAKICDDCVDDLARCGPAELPQPHNDA
jgi:hypothetical protein